MDFLVELFRILSQHQDRSMSHICNGIYSKTLKNWHGWLASSNFSVIIDINDALGVHIISKNN